MAGANLERVKGDSAERHWRRGQTATQTEAIPEEDEAEHERLRYVAGERHPSDRGEETQEPVAALAGDGAEKESHVAERKRHCVQWVDHPAHEPIDMNPARLLEELQAAQDLDILLQPLVPTRRD